MDDELKIMRQAIGRNLAQEQAMKELVDSSDNVSQLFDKLFVTSRNDPHQTMKVWSAGNWFSHGLIDDYANRYLNKALSRELKQRMDNFKTDFIQTSNKWTSGPALELKLNDMEFEYHKRIFKVAISGHQVQLWRTTGMDKITILVRCCIVEQSRPSKKILNNPYGYFKFDSQERGTLNVLGSRVETKLTNLFFDHHNLTADLDYLRCFDEEINSKHIKNVSLADRVVLPAMDRANIQVKDLMNLGVFKSQRFRRFLREEWEWFFNRYSKTLRYRHDLDHAFVRTNLEDDTKTEQAVRSAFWDQFGPSEKKQFEHEIKQIVGQLLRAKPDFKYSIQTN